MSSAITHLQACRVEPVMVDVAPIVGRGIYGETGRDGAIWADDHIVLTGISGASHTVFPLTPF